MLSKETLKHISKIFCGDEKDLFRYKKSIELVDFFNNNFNKNDIYYAGFPSKAEKEETINNLKNEIEKIKNISLENKEILEENKNLRNYLKEDVLSKEMVDSFIDTIYVYDRKNIKIDWKFKK